MSFLSCAEMLTYAHEHSCTLAQAVTVTGTDVDTAIEEFRTAATNIIG